MILVILLRISQEHVVIIYCEIFAIGLTTLLAFDVTKIWKRAEIFVLH